ncbi:TPA: hypothetical protein DIU22_02180 [Candidatus Woesebacteria bacterium]|nr:hypothetical protein [Candidatus Woesebacteria bacterium]
MNNIDKIPYAEIAPFIKIYGRLLRDGKLVSPRGLLIKEIENANYVLPPYIRFANFNARKLNLNYIKQEFLWYLKGDRYDTSITEHAQLWKGLIQPDGGINSNYGVYINRQFDNVISILTKDKDSRRASIMILSSEHLLSNSNDCPCSYALNFRIRENKLNMTVHMRSQDSIFGMGNDAPTFSFIQEMIYMTLRSTYSELVMGNYHHFVDSLHVYEKHFSMLEEIVNNPTEFESIECPRISSKDEVDYLRKTDFKKQGITHPVQYQFVNWLTSK